MKELMELFQEHFKVMCSQGILFRSTITGREVWDMYLSSFNGETDPQFRDPDSSVHNCNCCNNFVRRYGNVVAIDKNNNIITLFDIVDKMSIDNFDEYSDSFDALSKLIKSAKVGNIFLETFNELKALPYEECKKNNKVFRLGIAKNHKRYTKEEAEIFGVVKANETRTFRHFHLDLPKAFVDFTGSSIESISAVHRSSKDVFYRGLETIPRDTLELVRDLINQGSLLNGDAHLSKLEVFLECKIEFDALPANQRENWCWVKSNNFPFAKFRNELMGQLCKELAEGEELNKACQSWNKRVDPANYMKAVAPITENQKRMAKKFVEENGYVESFDRRFATIDDIKANEIKHINVGDGKIKSVSMFDSVKPTKSTRHKRSEFEGIQEVTIEKFMEKILPTCTSIEAYLENRLEGNLVTMTTSKHEESKQMFKWDNSYSKTYKGNLAGKSEIKEAVKSQGGKVDGVCRFSIMWSEGDGDNSDLDAHCKEPSGGQHIYYSHNRSSKTGGNLDIDITNPNSHKPKKVVENITYPSLGKMIDGTYKFYVNQYAQRSSKGFTAEIEFDGELFQYTYNQPLKTNQNVQVAEVTLKDGQFSIKHILPSTSSSKELYGLDTMQFHKVNLMCLSPNHWGNNHAGNKHYLFMLENCKVDTSLRSFHSEDLEPELAKHRKVLEVLGAVNMLEPNNGKQLSGLGFNATVKDELVLRLKGSHKSMIKVKF